MLYTMTVCLRSCTREHGGCLGTCDGMHRLPFRSFDIKLPQSWVDTLALYRFHIAGDEHCGCGKPGWHWVIRDYDCLVARSGHDLDSVTFNFIADIYELHGRIARVGDQLLA